MRHVPVVLVLGMEHKAEIVQRCRVVRVVFRNGADGLLGSCNGFVNIKNIRAALIASLEYLGKGGLEYCSSGGICSRIDCHLSLFACLLKIARILSLYVSQIEHIGEVVQGCQA